MSGRVCKSAADCNGELMEAIERIPDLIIAEQITDPEAIDTFNRMKAGWAGEYARWKSAYLDFDAT